MTQSFSDNFNRANSASLGANWTALGGTGMTIASNQCAPASALARTSAWVTNCDTDDNYSQAAFYPTTGSTQQGLMARCTDISNYYRLYYVQNTTTLTLAKVVTAVATDLVSNTAITLVNGDIVRLEVGRTTLSGYVNGALVVQTTDGGLTTGKIVGLRASGANGSAYDDWAGGDLVVTYPVKHELLDVPRTVRIFGDHGVSRKIVGQLWPRGDQDGA